MRTPSATSRKTSELPSRPSGPWRRLPRDGGCGAPTADLADHFRGTGGILGMRHTLRLSASTALLANAAGGSSSAEQPHLSDDLNRQLAPLGRGDVKPAGYKAND